MGAHALNVDWQADVLGGGFEKATLALRPGDDGPLEATLVRLRRAPEPTRRAVLYVHGYNDYFFQQDLAGWFVGRGHDFYAVDLRRYGRSLIDGQTPNYTDDLADYDEDLDAAVDVILAAGHQRLIIVAHSNGGLTAPLWLSRRPSAPVDGVVLNSPFLEFKQPAAVRAVASRTAAAVARRQPMRVVPAGVDSNYGDSLHVAKRGEWDYDLAWKPSPGFPVRLGWVRAIVEGHRALHAGLGLRMPVLMMASTRTITTKRWDDDLQRADSVLDADSIARWAPSLGRNVTLIRIEDGMHDLYLSPRPARDRAYDATATWLGAWVD